MWRTPLGGSSRMVRAPLPAISSSMAANAGLDSCIAKQADPKPSTSLIRRFVELALGNECAKLAKVMPPGDHACSNSPSGEMSTIRNEDGGGIV
jgi:hypothetical protein